MMQVWGIIRPISHRCSPTFPHDLGVADRSSPQVAKVARGGPTTWISANCISVTAHQPCIIGRNYLLELQKILRWITANSITTIKMLRPRITRALPTLRRSIHRLPPLEKFQDGIPGLFTPGGFRIAWTEYQSLMLEKLNALTVGA